jgi:hypothetical protein
MQLEGELAVTDVAAIGPERSAFALPGLVSGWLKQVERLRSTGGPTRLQTAGATGSGQGGVMEAPSRLVQVFAMALLDVGREAEGLALGRVRREETAVQPAQLLRELLDAHAPLAASAGLRLSRATELSSAPVCLTDARLLRTALNYLTLRVLVGEPAPGHVRVAIAEGGGEVRISFISRAAPPASGELSSDLATVGRLLHACGAQLATEMPYGGYAPVILSLRAVRSAALARAA